MAIATDERTISDAKYKSGREIERTSKVFARSMIPTDRPLRILDVGCGTGLNAEALKRLGHTIVGIDLSDIAIEKFRQAGFEGLVGDIVEGTSFPSESFDLVFASEVIEHVVNTDKFLREVKRVLKPNGTLLLTTPNSAFWVYRIFAVLGRTLSEVQHPGHVRFFSKAGLVSALKQYGFAPRRVAGRHMYLIVGHRMGKVLALLPNCVRPQREMRFKTQSYFWHLSRPAERASSLWADTLIIEAEKVGV